MIGGWTVVFAKIGLFGRSARCGARGTLIERRTGSYSGIERAGIGFGSGTGDHNQRLTSRAMAKAAAAAREPTIAVCKALRTGATPVNWPLTPPKIRRAARVSAIETGSARETVSSRK